MADASGIRGVVELGVTSLTAKPEAALQHADGTPLKLLFEVEQGLVDRAAELAWLSMYPWEEEFALPPLTALEALQGADGSLRKTAVGDVAIVHLRPSVSAPHAAPHGAMESTVETATPLSPAPAGEADSEGGGLTNLPIFDRARREVFGR